MAGNKAYFVKLFQVLTADKNLNIYNMSNLNWDTWYLKKMVSFVGNGLDESIEGKLKWH